MHPETLPSDLTTETLLQTSSMENITGFEIENRDLTDSERYKKLLETNEQIKIVHDLFAKYPENLTILNNGYGNDRRKHAFYNDPKNNISIRISPEGYIDVLTMVDVNDVAVSNTVQHDKLLEYASLALHEETPVITVLKKYNEFQLVSSPWDKNFGGNHRTQAHRYIGDEKVWAFQRLTDVDGYVIKLFREIGVPTNNIEEKLVGFISS